MATSNLTNRLVPPVVSAAIAAITLIGSNPSAQAAAIRLGRIGFSEASGDFTITGGAVGRGTPGTRNNPFRIYETITGPNTDVTIAVTGLVDYFFRYGNPSGTPNRTGFWLQTLVTNQTNAVWNFFDHELQEVIGVPSSHGDGLSFSQEIVSIRPFTSSRFSSVEEDIDQRDFVNFSGGSVAPGETVVFNYVITDNSPLNTFYIRQRPNFRPGQPSPPDMGGLPQPDPQPAPQPNPQPAPSPEPIPREIPVQVVQPSERLPIDEILRRMNEVNRVIGSTLPPSPTPEPVATPSPVVEPTPREIPVRVVEPSGRLSIDEILRRMNEVNRVIGSTLPPSSTPEPTPSPVVDPNPVVNPAPISEPDPVELAEPDPVVEPGPVTNPEPVATSVPEPSSVLGLLTLAALAGVESRFKRKFR